MDVFEKEPFYSSNCVKAQTFVQHKHSRCEIIFIVFSCIYDSLTVPMFGVLSSMLADKLNMTPEEAERWIVNLIRNARLDAKIDSKLVRLSLPLARRFFSPLNVPIRFVSLHLL